MSNKPIKRGWFWPPKSRRAHFFNNRSTSLCGGFWLFAFDVIEAREFEDLAHNSPDNCARCRKMRTDANFNQEQ